MESTVTGSVFLDETDGVELTSVRTQNGAITITTGGDTSAVLVRSTTDADANDITITASAGASRWVS